MKGTQVRIDQGELDAILRHAFGERRGIAVTQLGGGQINDTRLLAWPDGTRCILRVAPSDATAAAGPSWFTAFGLRREEAVIAAAHELAGFLPVTTAHDFERAVIDRDWVIQDVMPGVPLSEVDRRLDPDARADVWAQVGLFTRRLHDVRGSRFGFPACGPRFDRWSELVAWDAAGLAHDAGRFGLPVDPFARLVRQAGRIPALLDTDVVPSLIHSDLWMPHIFVARDANGGHRLSGVIDLEFARFADSLAEHLPPSFDWGNVPGDMRSAFTAGYGPLTSRLGDGIRTRVYVAVGLGWAATLKAFQGQPYANILVDFERVVLEIERQESG
jgi:hypothetical protein